MGWGIRLMDCLLGLDVGTAGTRATLVAPSGDLVAVAERPHPTYTPRDGWAEQDPDAWLASGQAAIRDVLERVPSVSIAAVGVAGQMSGPVLLDDAGRAIGRCLIWSDVRAAAESEAMASRDRTLLPVTGRTAFPGYVAPKLLWLRARRAGEWARARTFVMPKDYLRRSLTGVTATDPTDASNTMLFDVTRRRWDAELTARHGLPANLLPDVVESLAPAGTVTSEAASRTGLPSGTPVFAGAGDSIAAAIGTGVVSGGRALLVIGSAGNVSAVASAPAIDLSARVHTGAFATRDTWILTGVQQSAGLALRWLRDVLDERSAPVSFEQLAEEAAAVPPGSDGLLFLPHLAGERNPRYAPERRAVWFGLSLAHSAAHLARSVMEGVAYSQHESLMALAEMNVPVHSLALSGGGSRSALWRSILASVSGLPVATPVDPKRSANSTGLGAAAIAGVGCGLFDALAGAAAAVCGETHTTMPDRDAAGAYAKLFGIYTDLEASLEPCFRTLAAARRATPERTTAKPTANVEVRP